MKHALVCGTLVAVVAGVAYVAGRRGWSPLPGFSGFRGARPVDRLDGPSNYFLEIP